MANTYKKIYLQIVFSVKNRESMLEKEWRAELFKYIAGIINKRGHYPLAVNGFNDHLHIFFDYKGHELIGDLVREIKKSSNKFVNDIKKNPFKFEWQAGYGVFSHDHKQKDIIIKYVLNQEEHHSKKSFRKEYIALLESYEIEFKDEYVFDFFE